MAKVVGIGAVMIHANDAEALARWYSDCLGIETEFSSEDGCYYAELKDRTSGKLTPFGIYPAQAPLAEASRAVMVNYKVDDLDEFVVEVEDRGVTVGQVLSYSYGKFAYVTDPEGNPIELWQETESTDASG
jgi:predicted enzyme related to lactoylglutathione lyase